MKLLTFFKRWIPKTRPKDMRLQIAEQTEPSAPPLPPPAPKGSWADQVRRFANENCTCMDLGGDDLQYVMAEIEKAAKRGSAFVEVTERKVTTEVIDTLKKEGFRVKYSSFYSAYFIEWARA